MNKFRFLTILIFIIASVNTAFAEIPSQQRSEFCGEKDCEFLFKEIKRFARNGSPLAQATLSVMYANGIGTEIDQELSLKYIKRAANNGLPFAEYSLGMLYRKNQLVGKYGKDADYWLKKAARNKFKPAVELLINENKIIVNKEKMIIEDNKNYAEAVNTPEVDEDVEVIVVMSDKHTFTDFYDILKSEGYGNPSQTGSRIKGRGCGSSMSPCRSLDVHSAMGQIQLFAIMNQM
jgi:hypothetical protein